MTTLLMETPSETTQLDEATMQDRAAEVQEWLEAFDQVVAADAEQASDVLGALRQRAGEIGVSVEGALTTPYRNTIAPEDEVPYPGDRSMERRVEALIRWNANGDGAFAE